MKKIKLPHFLLLLACAALSACNTSGDGDSKSRNSDEPGDGRSVAEILKTESLRTKPDYITYVPGSFDYSTNDSHNEHFLVFDGPDKSLMTIWTQAVCRSKNGNRNRIVFSRSGDQGRTWAAPKHLAGPQTCDDSTKIASWAFPMVSDSGRIYVLFSRNTGVKGWIYFHTGIMEGIYSDDNGVTWSDPQQVPMERSIYDDPEGKIPSEWIVWQVPGKDLKGNYFVGYTRWVNPKKALLKKVKNWTYIESVVEFMRFTNIHQNPEPRDIVIQFAAWGDKALRAPHYIFPELSVAQEPSVVRLPDNRLFCTMRSNSGYLWYSVSRDDGHTWDNPRPLLRKDHGAPILQPVSSSPIYQLADDRYVLLHHNNRGDLEVNNGPRHPAFIALGEFRPNADQPVWFSRSKMFLDTDGAGPDGTRSGNNNAGVYTSFTKSTGHDVLWHPDRKFYLLGKNITADFLKDLKVPE